MNGNVFQDMGVSKYMHCTCLSLSNAAKALGVNALVALYMYALLRACIMGSSSAMLGIYMQLCGASNQYRIVCLLMKHDSTRLGISTSPPPMPTSQLHTWITCDNTSSWGLNSTLSINCSSVDIAYYMCTQ